MIRLATVFLCVLVLAGCAGSIRGLPVMTGGAALAVGDPAFATHLQMRYLGAGGVLLKRGDDAIVTAPFFTNPSIARVAFATVHPDTQQVDRFLRPIATALGNVDAILVGHAHYDHLLDLAYARRSYLPQAKIYGSRTMKNTLAPVGDIAAADVIALDAATGAVDRLGPWTYAAHRRLRFMALDSEHAPIFLHLKFSEGEYTQPLAELPQRATDWREGKTLAFVIDFLRADGTVDFRVHYQDAASTPPLGFPPDIDGRRVDVAILCVPGFDQVEGYPRGIVERTRPRYVVGIHWENFFRTIPDDPDDLALVPTLDANRFIATLTPTLPRDAQFLLPAPTTWMTFPPAP